MPYDGPGSGDIILQQLLLIVPLQLIYAFILYLFAKREGRWGVQVALAMVPVVGMVWFGIYMLRMQLRVLDRLNALEASRDAAGSGPADVDALRRLRDQGELRR
jgi:hypothetical protein